MSCINCDKIREDNDESGDILCASCNIWVCANCSLETVIPKDLCHFCNQSYCEDNCGHLLIDTKISPYDNRVYKICTKHFTNCVECGENKALNCVYNCFGCHKLCESICLDCLYQKKWKIYETCWREYDGFTFRNRDYFLGDCLEFADGNPYFDESNPFFDEGNISMFCPDCEKVKYSCDRCMKKEYCKGCKNVCERCEQSICQACYIECEICEKIFCNDCSIRMSGLDTCFKDMVAGDAGTEELRDRFLKLIDEKNDIKIKYQELESKCKALEAENTHLKYAPGGSGYEEARTNFEQLASNTT